MYWGNPDATVSFCEDKYKVTTYIAEYYNTMSAFSYIIVGCLFYFTKIKNISKVLILLGIGTMVLHSTLRFYGQWLDELSMLVLSFSIIRYLRNDLFKKKTSKKFLLCICFLYFCFCRSFLYFFITFTLMQIYIFNLAQKKRNIKNKFENKLITCYTISLVVAIVCWFLDQTACSYVKDLQLHACWHVGTALAMLFGFMAIIISY